MFWTPEELFVRAIARGGGENMNNWLDFML
jgi:hypothetical protein